MSSAHREARPEQATIRAMIVDDEPPAREGLRLHLQSCPDIAVIGEFGSAATAARAIRRDSPDLLFLDVQMPGGSGLELLEDVGFDAVPVVVFVTAYDQYAVRAFEAHALDYLLKPYDPDRFEDVIGRAREHVRRLRDGRVAARLRSLVAELGEGGVAGPSSRDQPLARLAISADGRTTFINIPEVEWIEADGDYVQLHRRGQTVRIRASLTALTRRLDPARFVRTHRSRTVNLEFVKELQPYFHGDSVAILTTGVRVPVSRRYRSVLVKLLAADL